MLSQGFLFETRIFCLPLRRLVADLARQSFRIFKKRCHVQGALITAVRRPLPVAETLRQRASVVQSVCLSVNLRPCCDKHADH